MPAPEAMQSNILTAFLPMIIILIIHFIPSGIAFIKRNLNLKQVIILNLMPLLGDFAIGIVTAIVSALGILKISFFAIVALVISIIWYIICIIIWFIALVKAIRGY